MPSRVIHQVRCRSPHDSQIYVDVAVIDAISVKGPDDQEIVLATKASLATPFIKDDTGDGNGKGEARNATRCSHMERVKSTDDDTQKFDIEVLDALCFTPPKVDTPSDTTSDNENLHGLLDSGQYGGAQRVLAMPAKDAALLVVDKTGLGLDHSESSPTRSGHINLVTEKGNTDDKTDGIRDAGDTVPPTQLAWAATFKVDGLSIKGPNGALVALILPPSGIDEQDSTQMTTDPDTGEPCPPDNADPNVYIGWPKDSDSQGTNVGNPQNDTTGKHEPIDMGILWYIKKVSPGFNPWFWFADINTPLAFSYFGSPGRLGSWGYRGFVLWNNYPVIWLLSVNNKIQPMGNFGSVSLEVCAESGNWDEQMPPVPSAEMTGFEGGAFAPFGLLPMTHVQLGNPPDANPYGEDGDGSKLWDGRPNIWQLTGLPQPDRYDMTKPWNPFTNPNKFPTKKKAKECAELFKTNWNAVATGHNSFIEQYVGGGGVSNGGPSYTQPPGWAWAIPWYDGFIGHGTEGYPSEGYRSAFQNGIPPGVATHSLPLEIYTPATSWTLDIDQLDVKKWDTTKMEFTKNPINYFLPIVGPPVTWASER
jgi:hypothetical protein